MSLDDDTNSASAQPAPWYKGVTSYQWLILVIASAGWVFDVYEGQIFNITGNNLLRDVLAGEYTPTGAETESEAAARLNNAVTRSKDMLFGVFLLGSTIGGLVSGSLADRFGRRPILVATILVYTMFSGLTYFAESLWQVAVLRFLVAAGTGGEWAVAASLVAEVFPAKARAHASGIFHASSTLGTWLAAVVGIAVGEQWRYAYLIGVAPALLILWVRASVREPERWEVRQRQVGSAGMGNFTDLWSDPVSRRRVILGTLLAAVGLATFWAVTVAGQDLARLMALREGLSPEQAAGRAKFAYGIIQATGGGLGLLAFGPLSACIGRRWAFVLFQLAAIVIIPVTCFAPQNLNQLLVILPLFGFLTLGIHAGYAIYFPELFPTKVRALGASFCFNGGRLLAAPVLFISGDWKAELMKNDPTGENFSWALSGLGLLFLFGVALALALPETRARELPE